MFWRKVDCDGCNAKIRAKGAIFHRGSYFCNADCRDTWERANPPRVAQGDPAQLKYDLIHTIDAALDEYRQSVAGPSVEQLAGRMVPLVGSANARYDAQVRHEHSMRFTEYTHECIPIVRALGYDEEAAVLATYGFGGNLRDIIAALERARARAAT
ncbi:MAG: hypothetical protein AB7P03_22360 [Kofleriaceae bacterium]